jgi:hypothetical protein
MSRFIYRIPGSYETEDLLLRSQYLFLALDALALTAIAIFDLRLILSVLFVSAVSFLLFFAGRKLYQSETTESWLVISIGDTLKNTIGWIFLIAGWVIFLRGVLVTAIASAVLFFE